MKYINACIKRFTSLIYCIIIKILNYKTFFFHLEEMISLSVRFCIRDKGKILLGKRCGMRKDCELSVSKKGKIIIGDYCFFNKGVTIVSHEKITIGNKTKIGPNVMIFDHDYDFTNSDKKKREKHITSEIKIGSNVWIGAGCIILRGTKIGDNCVVAAGSVLTGEYESNSLIIQKRIEDVRQIKYTNKRRIDL